MLIRRNSNADSIDEEHEEVCKNKKFCFFSIGNLFFIKGFTK
jgi:hypothetical protein